MTYILKIDRNNKSNRKNVKPRLVRIHSLRHPAGMGVVEVQALLTWLALERQVSVSSHRQALSALLFL